MMCRQWSKRHRGISMIVISITICAAVYCVQFVAMITMLRTNPIGSESAKTSDHAHARGEDAPNHTSHPPFSITSPIAANSTTIPTWMSDYFQWHAQQLNELNDPHVDWDAHRFLIMRCATQDRCGGTSDRLKSLPLFLLMGAISNRILFIRWQRPFPLENFLLPTATFNWTVPNNLQVLLDGSEPQVDGAQGDVATSTHSSTPPQRSRSYDNGIKVKNLLKDNRDGSIWLVEGNVQSGGAAEFRQQIDLQTKHGILKDQPKADDNYLGFYHDMFHTVFHPSSHIEQMVVAYMTQLKLTPNEYTVAHYRSTYPGEPYRETKNVTILRDTMWNAINCGLQLNPGYPVYAAADTVLALQMAETYNYTEQRHAQRQSSNNAEVRVVSHLHATQYLDSSKVTVLPREDPLHLNFAKPNDASGFYSIFLDIYVMANSRCVTFGAGGFGRFGSLLSFNASCRSVHSRQGVVQHCDTP